jgi:acetolactate synthase-1/2/3 large subunit
MTGGEAIIRQVAAHGVDTVFGLPGVQMYPLFDALQRSNSMRTVCSRHEQGAAYMAYGATQTTGRPSAFSVVPGPGVLNATAALCTAWGKQAPVICLTGQVPSAYLGKGRGHLHELPDQRGTLRSLIKWAQRIDRPQDAPALVNEAFTQMLSGRPGPVSVEMCWDVMAQSADVELLPPSAPDAAPDIDPDAIAAAANLIADAPNVMIMVGGGARHAIDEVHELARQTGACVTSFRAGRGIVPEDVEYGLSIAAAYEMWADTQVLIAIGTRAELQYMRWSGMRALIEAPEAPPHLIRIEIDPEELERLKPHVGIVGDSRSATAALIEALATRASPDPDWAARMAEAKVTAHAKIQKIQPQLSYLDVIRDVLPKDGIFVDEVCQAGFTSYFGFPVHAPYTYVTSGFQGTLGYGYHTALGAKAANPGKAVVSINGDGGFMYGVQELATAAQYGLGVVAIVFNNAAFGNVRRDQQTLMEGRLIGSELVNPDFVKLAESFGIAGHRATSPQALKPLLERAIADDRPALIEVPIERDVEVSPWEFIIPPPPGSSRSY